MQTNLQRAADDQLPARWSSRSLKAVIVAGIVAGALDIVFAVSIWQANGVPATAVLQTIASGVIGKSAYGGGSTAAAMGLFLHFVMTLIMALIYNGLIPRSLRHRPLTAGALYGACIWAVMNLVVVPLSAAAVGLPPVDIAAADFAAHLLLVGIPIAFLNRAGVTDTK